VVRCSKWSMVEWTYEGGLKCECRVDANGNLSVISGVHMLVCMKSGCIRINLGGTAEVDYKLLSLSIGTEVFFISRKEDEYVSKLRNSKAV